MDEADADRVEVRGPDSGAVRAIRSLGVPAGAEAVLADDDFRRALADERIRGNLARLRTLLPVLAVLHWAAAVAFTLVPTPAGAAGPEVEVWRESLRWANGSMGLVAVVLALLVWRSSSTLATPFPGWARLLPEAAALGYLVYAAVVSGIDQPVTGSLMAYMVAVFAVAFFARMAPASSAACYGAGGIALWVVLSLVQPSAPLRLSSIVNGTILTALGWGLSLVLERAFVRDFVNGRTIAAQQGNLERANDRLAESLGALQRANAELVQEVRVRTLAERELARLATNDPLTDVANRRRFLEIAEGEHAGAAAKGGALAVAMIDVDNLKPINDEHGHAIGDEVLRAVAARCVALSRDGDTVGRLGGDEFGILLAGADLEAATGAAARIATTVRAIEITVRGGVVRPSVSIGVTVLDPTVDDAVAKALARADEAMYQAKRAGRGRVFSLESGEVALGDSPS
jgi:diguanylate cyclase (GGDEF)-like protein